MTSGTGIDVDAAYIDLARSRATLRGIDNRVAFLEASSASHHDRSDVVISLGSYHAFGDIPQALTQLHNRTNPGGRLIFGAEIWSVLPTAEQLEHMWEGTTVDECLLLPDLADVIAEAGWRVLALHTSTREEWEEFECGHLRAREEWLVHNPDHEKASELRASLDKSRNMWLRGHRDVMGFATFTLAPLPQSTNDQVS